MQEDGLNNYRELEVEDLVGQSFSIGGGEDGNEERRWGVWGRFERGHFDNSKDTQDVSGNVATVFVGADITHGDWLTGVAVSRTNAEGHSYSHTTNDEVSLKAQFNSAYPYVRYNVDDKTHVWAMLGFGSGTLEINNGHVHETDLRMTMGAAGAYRELGQYDNGISTAFKSDVFLLKMKSGTVVSEFGRIEESEAEVSRARFVFEAEREIGFDNGGVLTPMAEVGVRYDGGDAQTGSGIEMGLGLRYTAPGSRLTFESKGYGLLVSENAENKEWGLGIKLCLEPEQRDGRGLSFTIEPSLGEANENSAQRLWSSSEQPQRLSLGEDTSGDSQLHAGVSYGLEPNSFGFDRVVTPFADLNVGSGRDVFRVGARWNTMEPLGRMSLEAQHYTSGESVQIDDSNDESVLMLRMDIRW